MVANARHSVSVAGIVVDRASRALVICRRDNGHWEPPGGQLDLAESIRDGLRREFREETGLEIEPERLTGIYKNMSRGILALVFRCHVTGGTLATSTETTDYRWAHATEIRALMDEAYAVRVIDALTDATEPAVREHDGISLVQPQA